MEIAQFLYVLLLAFFLLGSEVSATVFTLKNSCSRNIWPGTLSVNGGAVLGDGGFKLSPGASIQITAPPGWSGRFWARTGCNFDASGQGQCNTGDCGRKLKCTGSGATPVSLAEFTLDGGNSRDMDFYDVSLVDGYNVALGIQPSGGAGNCKYAGCVANLNKNCPAKLQVVIQGEVVACKSACAAFGNPEYCCTGNHRTSATCPPTNYSRIFKNACPSAYSYAYDDQSSTFTCSGANYSITFCPNGS